MCVVGGGDCDAKEKFAHVFCIFCLISRETLHQEFYFGHFSAQVLPTIKFPPTALPCIKCRLDHSESASGLPLGLQLTGSLLLLSLPVTHSNEAISTGTLSAMVKLPILLVAHHFDTVSPSNAFEMSSFLDRSAPGIPGLKY